MRIRIQLKLRYVCEATELTQVLVSVGFTQDMNSDLPDESPVMV